MFEATGSVVDGKRGIERVLEAWVVSSSQASATFKNGDGTNAVSVAGWIIDSEVCLDIATGETNPSEHALLLEIPFELLDPDGGAEV